MNENLLLENFGHIGTAEIELSPIITISGSRTDEKLAVAKLISIFRHWEFAGRLDNFSGYFDKYQLKDFLKPNTRIQYKATERNIDFTGNAFITESKLTGTDEKIREERVFMTQVNKILDKALDSGNTISNDDFSSQLSSIKQGLEHFIYVPAQRDIVAVLSETVQDLHKYQIPVPYLFNDFIAKYGTAKKHTQEIALENLGIKYLNNGQEEWVENEQNRFLKLSSCPSEVQSVLIMYILLDFYA